MDRTVGEWLGSLHCAHGIVPSAAALTSVVEATDSVPDGPSNSGNSPGDIRSCYVDADQVTIEGYLHPTTREFIPRLIPDNLNESKCFKNIYYL